MKETIQLIPEYAQLVQKCRKDLIKDKNQLPKGWQVILYLGIQDTWDTFYALYVSDVKKEVVLCIRGTDNLLKEAEVNKLTKAEHFTKESRHLSQIIKDFNQVVGLFMNNWVLALYSAAINKEVDAPKELKSKLESKLNTPKLTDDELKSTSNLGNMLIKFKDEHYPNFTFKIVGHSLGGVIAELFAVKVGVECITFESPGARKILKLLPEYEKNKRPKIVNVLSAPNIINTLNKHPGTTYRVKLEHTAGTPIGHSVNSFLQTTSLFGILKKPAKFVDQMVGEKYNSLAGLWKDFNWLKDQHSIDNVVDYLVPSDNDKSKDPQLVKMNTWPTVDWKNPTNRVDRIANNIRVFVWDLIPSALRKDKSGVRNITNDEVMREAQIKDMPGYKETSKVIHFRETTN